ncbi:MAG: hypothetical protein JWN98_2215, partial [Abditibacteriota bacterium]|nr:hypothetical protein [Abditibacteriota bacterium]
RDVAREVLIDELWPEATQGTGRNNLRIALSSLRRQLEPPDIAPGSVVRADRNTVGFNLGAVITDIEEFEAHLQAAHAAGSSSEEARAQRRQHLSAACELFRAPLLPGYYENWIAIQSQYFEGQFFSALLALIDLLESSGNYIAARDWVWRGLAVDPDHRELHLREITLSQRATAVTTSVPEERPRLVGTLNEAVSESSNQNSSAEAPAASPSLPLLGNAASISADTRDSSGAPLQVRLPPVWNRFFAREREIALLTSWLHSDVRLITLHGAGGSGKTRLAIEIARQLATSAAAAASRGVQAGEAPEGASASHVEFDEVMDSSEDAAKVLWESVAFVPLAAITRAELITVAIADALQLSHADELPPLDRVVHALDSRSALLILDNFEQLVGDGATVVQTLLERLPQLKLLVTSRQRLDLPGEREWALSPLPLPPLEEPLSGFTNSGFAGNAITGGISGGITGGISGEHSPASQSQSLQHPTFQELLSQDKSAVHRLALEWPSVRLFADRARAVRPDFGITRRNARDVITLVRKLEGLPLAIELAAARAGVLSPGAMLAQLDAPLDFLQTRRVVEPRHAGLRACIAWSYRLLPPDLQGLWTCLSVLRGGWSLEAACAVCCGGETNATRQSIVLQQLEALRDASFIIFDEQERASGAWFRMLEVLQAFADEQLTVERRAILQARHASYCAELTERMEMHFTRTGYWLGSPDADQGNFRALFERALEQRDVHLLEAALRTAGSLWWFWPSRGHIVEARDYLRRLLDAAFEYGKLHPERAVPTSVIAKAKLCAGLMAYHGGQSQEARTVFESAFAEYQAMEDVAGMASAHNYLGSAALSRMDIEAARAHFQASLEMHREHNDTRQMAVALSCLTEVAVAANDAEPAQRHLREARELWRQLNDRGGLGWLLSLEGALAENNHDVGAASAFFQQSLEMRQRGGAAAGIATALFDVGRSEDMQGHYNKAHDLYQRSLTIRRRLGHHRALLDILEAIAGVQPLATPSTLSASFGAPEPETDAEAHSRERARRAT